MSRTPTIPTPKKSVIRCAIYTRKSTEEGLQQEFNTLDAQRQSAEAYIAAQKHEGWVCLPERYDDGGFTGANTDRPAFQRLLKDIEDGKIDAVVVYKVDRLSRSLRDFARIMEVFDARQVSFVSVTQQFNTSTPMGRLMLHILLSFAQFERETTAERTRDKIAAARRKGKFAGGKPVLGYDLLSNPTGPKLIVNEEEAILVRAIFELYLQQQALIPVVMELAKRGWTTKVWQTKDGRRIGGRPLDKNLLYHMLTNVVYLGKVRYHDEVHPGEHAAIVDEAIWQRVQAMLQRNRRTGSALVRNKHGALLRGLLRCTACDCAMIHTYTSQGNKRYRYYACLHATKHGWTTCPTRSVPAAEIERFVVEQIQVIGRDAGLVERTVAQAKTQLQAHLEQLRANARLIEKELGGYQKQITKATSGPNPDKARAVVLADQQGEAERRLTALRQQIQAQEGQMVSEPDLRNALAQFMPVWDVLSPREQTRIVQLLVERVDYDGRTGTIRITFHPAGIKTLAKQHQVEEIAA